MATISFSRAGSDARSWFRPRLAIIGLVLLTVFALDTLAATRALYLPFDPLMTRAIQSMPFGPLAWIFSKEDELEGLRQFATGIGLILLVIVVSWRRSPLMLLGSLTGQMYQYTQAAIHRPRPSSVLVDVIRHTGSWSYPSGHVVFFTTYSVLLIVCLAYGRVPRTVLTGLWVAAGLLIASVCIGRVYMGEHWPSDVIGGLALAGGWVLLVLSVRPLSDSALGRP